MRQALLVLFVLLFAFPALAGESLVRQPSQPIYPWRGYVHECALGRNLGCDTRALFGLNVNVGITAEDIWSAGGLYAFYPTVAIEIGCESTDANDTLAGTGAQTLIVDGLDINRHQVREVIDLNGTTQVVVPTDMIRVNFIQAETQGGTATMTNIGTLFCEATAGGGGLPAGDNVPSSDDAQQVLPGQGASSAAIFSVPANKTAVFTGVSFQVGKANEAEMGIFYRPNNADVGDDGAWVLAFVAFVFQSSFDIQAGTVSHAPPGTDIRIAASKASGGGTVAVAAHFGLVLYDYVRPLP